MIGQAAVSPLGRAYDALRRQVLSGNCHAAAPIDLAALQLDSASQEVRSALAYLSAEGLLEVRDGGVFIMDKPARSIRSTGFVGDYSRVGRKPTKRTLSVNLLPVRRVEERFRSPFEEAGVKMVARHLHVQTVDDVPHAICDSYIPFEPFEAIYDRLGESQHDLFDLMAECSLRPDRKREVLRVDVPTQRERELLSIEDLSRVMVVRLDCVVWSQGRVVEVCELVDRADLYEFTYEVAID